MKVENPIVVGNTHDEANDDYLFDYDINGYEIHYGDEYLIIDGMLVLKDADGVLEFLKKHMGAVEYVAEK